MTTGEYLASLSSSSSGSTALSHLTNIEGTYAVFVPRDNFDMILDERPINADLITTIFVADLKNEPTEIALNDKTFSADLGNSKYTGDLK